MERITVTMQPLPRETRLLVMADRYQQAVSVVLCADDEASSSATRMFDDLGSGVKTVHYDVEVAFRAHPRRGRRIHGFDNFGELRQLCLEGVAS